MTEKFTFQEQMEENIKFSLTYPFHISHEYLVGNDYYNPEYPNSYHCHTFEDVLLKVYREPHAFYLTPEDEKSYSRQEVTFINKIKGYESKKLDEGMVITTFDLEEETLRLVLEYKNLNNMTFEEAMNDLLKKIVEEHKQK